MFATFARACSLVSAVDIIFDLASPCIFGDRLLVDYVCQMTLPYIVRCS